MKSTMKDYELLAEQLTEAARTGVVDTVSHVRLLMDAADAMRSMQRSLECEAARKYQMRSAFISYRASVRRELELDDE